MIFLGIHYMQTVIKWDDKERNYLHKQCFWNNKIKILNEMLKTLQNQFNIEIKNFRASISAHVK